MELTQLQMSKFLSNYTSSSEGFVTLQSLIMNSLMKYKRGLFVANTEYEQCWTANYQSNIICLLYVFYSTFCFCI